MNDRALRGSTGWTESASVLDIGEHASSVHFGVLLSVAGAADLAGPSFGVVGTDVPVTMAPPRLLAAEPQGLDFGVA
jgi:hypothetical protein